MHPRFRIWIWTVVLISVLTPLSRAAENQKRPFSEEVTQPVREAVTIRQGAQRQDEQWRGDRDKLLSLYEKLQDEERQLKTDQTRLQQDIEAARGRIAEKEKQLADIEQIRIRIEPFLLTICQALRRQIDADAPFLPEERLQRLQRLEQLLPDPEVAISEKYRKAMEALMVEAEYGNTIEVYQQTIAVEGLDILVNIFRLGRVSLFYQSLDQSRCGFYDVAARAWRPLSVDNNRAIGAAIDIGAKRKPVELLSLPLGRIAPK